MTVLTETFFGRNLVTATKSKNTIQPKTVWPQVRREGYHRTILAAPSPKGTICLIHNDLDMKSHRLAVYGVSKVNVYSFFDEPLKADGDHRGDDAAVLSYTDDSSRRGPLAASYKYKHPWLWWRGGKLPSDTPTAGMYQPRLTGPIQFLRKLLNTWRLSQADAVCLLGLDEFDSSFVDALLNGRVGLRSRDFKDRIAYLFHIRKTLSALFRDETVENDWLREPHDALDKQTPMDIMLEGSMESLLLMKEYVASAAGR